MFLVEFKSRFIPQANKWQKQQKFNFDAWWSYEYYEYSKQERSQKGDSGCASEKLGVPHLLSD